MNKKIYARLAVTNIKNNRKTYVPYILASALTVMMYFIMDGLAMNDSIGEGRLAVVLECASVVIMVFAVIFLFYTNSFLIKRRKKEIGIYNILGMGKRHIAKMLMLETIIVAGISLGAGLLTGALFSKLMWLLLIRLLNYDTRIEYMIPRDTLIKTLVLFCLIFAMTLFYNLMQVRLAHPAELLRGSSQGEREPKTRHLLTFAGLVLVGYGYYTALTVPSPLAAVYRFLVAVIVVILGTYALFIAGSIAFLKLLKNNKNYYYKSSHFVSVSGMLYRMKQNAAGLASICILSTIVLILVSTSVSMYMGAEDTLYARYPREIDIDIYGTTKEKEEKLEEIIHESTKEYGVDTEDRMTAHYGMGAAVKNGNQLTLEANGAYGIGDVCEFYMFPQEDYNRMSGEDISLAEDEVLFYTTREDMYGWKSLMIDGETYRIKKEIKDIKIEKKSESRVVEGLYVIFSRMDQVEQWLKSIYETSDMQDAWLQRVCRIKCETAFNLKGNEEDCIAVAKEIRRRVENEIEESSYESRTLAREDFYGLYGGLLFIGIYLGLMFLLATVLIIYYKQITEGYDDRERYQVMQKIGMDKREVKRSIRSQVLTVFFLPLITAILHVAVAFTVVKKLLAILGLANKTLFLLCTAATIAIFAVFYVIVYGMTAREYYRIVG